MKHARIILFLIIILAVFVRLYKLTSIPPSLSWDEVAIGYDAYSIAETGKDQWGMFLPLAFKSFGEYKYPFHIYATVLFEQIFGVNEFGVRFGSVFFGIINVILLYFLVLELFNRDSHKQRLALLSTLLLAISPWHIQFSRVSWETNYTLFFFFASVICFYKYLNARRNYFLPISFIFLGLTVFTYNAAKVFVPIFVFALSAIYFKNLFKRKSLALFSLVIFISFLLFNLINPNLSGINRYAQLNFEESSVVATTLFQETHIYKLGWMELAVRNYLSFFSLDYLFLKGDPNPRHSIQTVGELLYFDILFIPLGLIIFFSKFLKRDKTSSLLLFWFFAAMIPGAIAREVPHASRSMFALGGWQIISAIGISYLMDRTLKSKWLFQTIMVIVILFPFVRYLKSYFVDYPTKYSQYWQYGYKEVSDFIAANYSDYEKIYVTSKYGEPQIFLLFYLKFPPEKYQNDPGLKRSKQGDWVKVFAFDKFEFIEADHMSQTYNTLVKSDDKKNLVVGTEGDFPSTARRLMTIYFLDGSEAFEIVEI